MVTVDWLSDTLEPEDGVDECDYVESDYEPAWEPDVTPFVDL